MRHAQPTDEMQAQAALYALGALGADELVAFEAHLAEGCRACETEVRAFRAVTGLLGEASTPTPPRPELRERLLARARGAADTAGWTVVRAGEGEWRSVGLAGVTVKWLFRDAATHRVTTLARLAPGTPYPGHRHADTEEVYVVAGDLTVEGQVLRAGDYCAARAGTVHRDAVTREGCTLLVHSSEHDQLLDQPRPGETEGLIFVLAAEGAWQPLDTPGVMRRRIIEDRAARLSTALVRMAAGARLPRHRHRTAEQFYMLEGDAHVTGEVLGAGDYYRAPAGSVHEITHTEGGCTFLLIASSNEVIA